MAFTEILGYFAAVGTTGAFIPQTIKVYKTKKIDDLSLGTFLFLSIGVLLWTIYGLLVDSLPIILANGITSTMAIYILFVIVQQKYFNKKSAPGKSTSSE